MKRYLSLIVLIISISFFLITGCDTTVGSSDLGSTVVTDNKNEKKKESETKETDKNNDSKTENKESQEKTANKDKIEEKNQQEEKGQEVTEEKSDEQKSDEGKEGKNEESVIPEDSPQEGVLENQKLCFFWGTWVRMDSGEKYDFYEDSIKTSSGTYSISSINDTSVMSPELGTFTKQSESVIVNNNIPYFKNCGTNLEYSLKIVGFNTIARAASSHNSIKGIKAVGKSDNYHSWKSESESNEDGVIVLTAPTSTDVQTVTLDLGNNNLIVVPGIQVLNSGSYMGTVALVGNDQYNLKITGKIAEEETNNGYIFGNNAKEYPLELTITNISENTCSSSICKIESKDPRLSVSSSSYNLQAFAISTMKPGGTKNLIVDVSYGDITDPFIDTGLDITITNPKTGQEWVDYVPLRFYKGLIPVTVAAKSPENNNNAALNGFIIYPDGNNQFFTVNNNSSKILLVPTFGEQEKYKIVFSGATTSAQLSDSTEMFYSVAPGANVEKYIDLANCDASTLAGYMNFAGSNQTEDTAYEVNGDFIAYLSDGEIDYYSFTADASVLLYNPSATNFYLVSYESEYGEVPGSFYVTEGYRIPSEKLPELTYPNQIFLGWYDGTHKVTARCCSGNDLIGNNYVHVYGHLVSSNIKLTAHWKPIGNAVISVAILPQTDIEVTRTQAGKTLTFSISNEYTVLGWYLENQNQGIENTFSLDTSSLQNGTYILELEAYKDNRYYSYTAQIQMD